jgi:hypothetical protein
MIEEIPTKHEYNEYFRTDFFQDQNTKKINPFLLVKDEKLYQRFFIITFYLQGAPSGPRARLPSGGWSAL